MHILSVKLIILLTILFFQTGCSASAKFKKLYSRSENLSDFYLIRPYSPALALWSFNVKILKYRDKFKSEEIPVQMRDFDLKAGEYIHFRLPIGHYKITAQYFKNSEKIIFIDGKSEKFMHFYLFSDGFFSGTELFFQEIEKKDALGFLLEGSNMAEHRESEP
ncbi:MAG TPA: hypothetical protein PL048_16460 [Leptospiraceae bacterium]|nr:hypothetical protein [Leptospiraceae bacterium]HMZ60372.1 hypothetical protein [Leptospiraceae bacterium]HNF13992.1 hypothetical protein [Leptospiraceae bacterium]HNM03330.1 hypothetical protein [Leptospiraceae bacterium]